MTTIHQDMRCSDLSNTVLNIFSIGFDRIRKNIQISILGIAITYLNHVRRKPVFAICEQQRRRSACASAQTDQHLCCSLLRQHNTYTCYIQNFKTLAEQAESHLVANPKDRVSRDEANFIVVHEQVLCLLCFKRIQSNIQQNSFMKKKKKKKKIIFVQ